MQFDHIHFYVENAIESRDWFREKLGFKAIASKTSQHTQKEIINRGQVYFALSSAITPASPVTNFLSLHPPGVADVAFRVRDITSVVANAAANGAEILQPIQENLNGLKWAKISGWGDLTHTLIEKIDDAKILNSTSQLSTDLMVIDHVVLNVAKDNLEPAFNWYHQIFNFQPHQNFDIQTNKSGLRSLVMIHPEGEVKFPINEPTSDSSQIQEFLDANSGAGIQHIALHTENILGVVGELRSLGLPFLQVPTTYYYSLQTEALSHLSETDWQKVQNCQILVDWQERIPGAMLLQIFTQPIFNQPTVFFEFIERKVFWVNGKQMQTPGFGQGNFQALFEAIEREQMKRGSLKKN
ncbi:MAG: 4-hydroxyphenylpyruvate dioxygenase [Trichodesmium sp. St16_bin4-tuft]|nr:4-hydroxyphenylpyruvate dioxygenase [Trichodesmium sp. St4_bin8_1]MDE5073089.1 4-hydroxyphenylpyruvate dioxygenase [Trichodesmium sp. St5_bin8]MDE5078109.1 4-hydroxyphenylpyruvate dioxygenase [Trichodesmium sp. St2_bin6]MDE5099014.1 4-hydroxyphenylpyruvate dioxygenase [Trichodesmium sp. St16_bin4-tuft]MDE5103834.1 4-hydroxyphenylpyruvate dioxygenase [Trichodesmium sp. St19_bin2]